MNFGHPRPDENLFTTQNIILKVVFFFLFHNLHWHSKILCVYVYIYIENFVRQFFKKKCLHLVFHLQFHFKKAKLITRFLVIKMCKFISNVMRNSILKRYHELFQKIKIRRKISLLLEKRECRQ